MWASTRTEYATRAVLALSLADGGACSIRARATPSGRAASGATALVATPRED